MKKALAAFLLVLLVLPVAGCSRSRSHKPAPPRKFKEYEGVVLKRVKAERLAVIRVRDTIARLPENFARLFRWFVVSQTEIRGFNTTIFFDDPSLLPRDDDTTPITYLVAMPVPDDTLGAGEVKMFDLDAYTAACILHRGPYTGIGESYRRLKEWMAANGYERGRFFREIYISGPGPRDPVDPNKWLTEIQIPVRRK